jgi:hypothetical protein
MKLIRITAKNFKGLSFSLALTDLTFLCGKNFSGKTARLDAIRFFLLGHVPELGKRAADTFGLSSSREMEVTGEFDDGSTGFRRLTLKGDSVKATNQLPEWLENANDAIATMMDPSTYFALSDREKITYVAAHCPSADGTTTTQVLDRVTAKAGKIPWPVGADEELLNATQMVEAQIVRGTEKLKELKSYAERMEKTVQGLGQIRLAEGQTVQDVSPALVVAREGLSQLREERGGHSKVWEQQRQAAHRRSELQHAPAGILEIQQRLKAKQTLLEQIRGKIEQLPQLLTPEARHALYAGKTNSTVAVERARDQWRATSAELTAAKRETNDLTSKTTCPYCGASGVGWRAIKERELVDRITDLTLKIDVTTAEGEKAKACLFVDTNLVAAYEATVAQHTEFTKQLNELEREIGTQTSLLRGAEAQAQELQNLPVADDSLKTKMQALDANVAVQEQKISQLVEQQRQADKRRNDLQSLAEAEKQRDDTKKDIEVAKSAIEELRVIQAELVTAAFTPLLVAANSFFSTVLRAPIAYHQGDLGYWRDGLWVGHGTMSGTEKALVYAAIQAALTQACPVRIMMIDELARLDDNSARLAILAIQEAVATGLIDNFIGVDTGRADLYRALGADIDSAELPTCQVLEIA